MPKPRAKTLTKVCERCGDDFTVPDKVNYREKRFCTRACSNAATAEKRAETLRSKEGYQHPTCPCWETVMPPPGQKWIYERQKKYCSAECRMKYGKKRQPDPANYVTFECLNCEKSVTRRKKYGHNKYCSNACAQRHTKVKRHYGIADLEIVFDSSYECLFWSLCAVLKIPIERFDRQYGVTWGEDCWYAPDFWLPSLGLAVEIKGPEDGKDATRWVEYRKQRGALKVLVRDDLTDMITPGGDLIRCLTNGKVFP